MPDPNVAEINSITLIEIYPVAVEDNFFKGTAFQSHLRAKSLRPFQGGTTMQARFIYKPLIGGFYGQGANFNIDRRTTIAATQFDPKYCEVSVPEFKEQIQVINKGPEAVYSLIDIDLRNGVNTISAIHAIALAQNGQSSVAGATSISPDNPAQPNSINGWVEGINDGLTPGWDGHYYTTYGKTSRVSTSVIGNALNSIPMWLGDSSGNAGLIQYSRMVEAYKYACQGPEHPDLGCTSKIGEAYMLERLQPQQRFGQEQDPYFGASGLKMMQAIILSDDYWPSAFGVNDPDLGQYQTGTWVLPSSASYPAQSNLPLSSTPTMTVGEVLTWFNTSKWLFRITDDPEYGFGFSGFVPSQDSTRVVGQIKSASNLQGLAPRLNWQQYGFAG